MRDVTGRSRHRPLRQHLEGDYDYGMPACAAAMIALVRNMLGWLKNLTGLAPDPAAHAAAVEACEKRKAVFDEQQRRKKAAKTMTPIVATPKKVRG